MRVLLLCLVTRQYCPAITIGRLNTATQGIIALGEKMLIKASLPVHRSGWHLQEQPPDCAQLGDG